MKITIEGDVSEILALLGRENICQPDATEDEIEDSLLTEIEELFGSNNHGNKKSACSDGGKDNE